LHVGRNGESIRREVSRRELWERVWQPPMFAAKLFERSNHRGRPLIAAIGLLAFPGGGPQQLASRSRRPGPMVSRLSDMYVPRGLVSFFTSPLNP